MRYSRMLEESSFPNRKADYFWLLFLSGALLLVGYVFSSTLYPAFLKTFLPTASFSTFQPAIPLLPSRIRSDLFLVSPTSINPYFLVRPCHHHGSIPPSGANRLQVSFVCPIVLFSIVEQKAWSIAGSLMAHGVQLLATLSDVQLATLAGSSVMFGSEKFLEAH